MKTKTLTAVSGLAVAILGIFLAGHAWGQGASQQDQPRPNIGRTYKDSKPAWVLPPQAPKGSPNVIYLVLDDVGYAQLGCFGSQIQTPNVDRIAAGGLRYTNFHTTSLCSPSYMTSSLPSLAGQPTCWHLA